MPEDRLQYLLEKFHAGACSPAEIEELEEEMLMQFRRRLAKQEKPVVAMPRRRIGWSVAAAAAILLIAVATIFYMRGSGNKEDTIVKNNQPAVSLDVLPGGNHATLTLADGSGILLDTAKPGGLAQQGISAIHKPVDGLLVYEPTETTGKNDVGMNMIRTPRGGQYQVQLPDGSKVWLNAASSIRFPVAFAGNERKVTITGEVYFEVVARITASGSKQSFIVDVAGKGEVEVLGTHFNINAYDDERTVKTTLLEGSVRVGNKTLKPGQQAQMSNNEISIIDGADTEEAVAWKNGLFKFNDADIQTILRQAARWYDIEVEIKGNDSGERFRGKIARDVKLSEFLRILEVNQVSFQTEGKKIIIQL